MVSRDVSPWAIRGLYIFALVLVLSPLVDFLATIWPMLPSELSWRYGFFGLLAGYLQTPILGLVLALAVAHWQKSGSVLWTLGILMLVVAFGLVLAMGLFGLDAMQVRAIRPEDQQRGVMVGAVLQEIKYGMAFLVLAVLGLGSVKTSAAHRSGGGKADSPGIVSAAG